MSDRLHTLFNEVKKALHLLPSQEDVSRTLIFAADSYYKSQNGLTGFGSNIGSIFDMESDAGQNHINYTKNVFKKALHKTKSVCPEQLEDDDIRKAVDLAQNAIPSADKLVSNIDALNASVRSKQYTNEKSSHSSDYIRRIQMQQQIKNNVYLLQENYPERFEEELGRASSPLNGTSIETLRNIPTLQALIQDQPSPI